MKNLILVDDDLKARLHLKKSLFDYCPGVNVVGEAADIPSAVRLIKKLNPTAVLLDVNLKDGTGFDLLNKFSTLKFKVIFTTLCGDFALKAFRYNAIDYLLKPVNPDELIQAVDKIHVDSSDYLNHNFKNASQTIKIKPFEKLALTTTNGMAFIRLDKIVYLKSQGSYTTFFIDNKKELTVCRHLKEFEGILPVQEFFRPHQSFIVNAHYVEKFIRDDGYYALMAGAQQVPVSRRKKDAFMEFLTEKVRN